MYNYMPGSTSADAFQSYCAIMDNLLHEQAVAFQPLINNFGDSAPNVIPAIESCSLPHEWEEGNTACWAACVPSDQLIIIVANRGIPEVIDGTANDPAPVPDPSPTHGSYHWAFER